MGRSLDTGIWLREEGITALNLQDLSEFDPQFMVISPFSPREESRETGADWGWWFLEPGVVFGAAVQAKCLREGRYDLAFKPRRARRLQIERLFAYCTSQGDVTPLYCLYNFWNFVETPVDVWPCGSFGPQAALWGCALLDGTAAWRLHAGGHYSPHRVLPFAEPWHCLTCCDFGDGKTRGAATRALAVSERLRERGRALESSAGELFWTELPPPRVFETPPPRLRSLLQARATEERIMLSDIERLWAGNVPRHIVIHGDAAALEWAAR